MPSDAHTAFSSFPTAARGVLCENNYQPLTIRGCAVNVEVKGYSARVRIAYEYINETNKNQAVIAAYALPYGWHVQSCEARYNEDSVSTHYMKNATVTSVDAASAVAALGGAAVSTDRSSAWCDVVSQRLPWSVIVGDAVHLVVNYLVLLSARDMISHFEMRLPLEQLIPPVSQPSKTTLEYNELFSTNITRAMYLPTAEVSIHIHAELCLPMRGEVKLAQLELDGVTQTTVEDMRVEHDTDAAFTIETKAHINSFRRLPLIFGCGVQDTEEPLRLFAEADTSEHIRPEDANAIAIHFTPRLFQSRPNAELVLLVDVHSQQNSAVVARAVAIGLAALPPSVRLNAVVLHEPTASTSSATATSSAAARRCGTSVFPEGSRLVSEVDMDAFASAAQALADGAPQPRVEKGGCSRVEEALRALLDGASGPLTAGPTAPGYARNVIVITDAGESAAKAPTMIQEVVSARHRGRVHALALLPAASGSADAARLDIAQLDVMAKQAGGLLVSAAGDDLAAVTRALVTVAAASAVPTLTSVSVKLFGGADSSAVLRPAFDLSGALPLMPHSVSHILYALAPRDVTHVSVIVTGRVGDQVVEYNSDLAIAEQPVNQQCHLAAPGDVATMGLYHAAAAARRISFLVEDHPHNASPSSTESKEIIALSACFALPSPYTQLVQTREKAAGSALASNVTIVASRYLPRYCLYPAELKAARAALMTARAAALSRAPLASAPPPQPPSMKMTGSTAVPTEAFMRGVIGHVIQSATQDGPSALALVSLQNRTDGSYALSAPLAKCARASETTLEAALPEGCPSQTAWATAIALNAMNDLRDRVTLLAAARAEAFLSAQCPADQPKPWQQWLAVAQSLSEE